MLGFLTIGSARIDSVVISVAESSDEGRIQMREGFKVGDRFHFEGIDGREADIEIRRVDPPNMFFSFINPLAKTSASCKRARLNKG